VSPEGQKRYTHVSAGESKGTTRLKEVDVRELRKQFKYRIGLTDKRTATAVDGVSFEIAKGEIFSLLGPNGAGKTTTIKMLCTLIRPTSGDAIIDGQSVVDEPEQVRSRIGVMLAGDRNMYWKLTGRDNLQYFAALYHLRPKDARERIEYLLKLVSLTEYAKVPVENYSTGMRIRLSFIKSLLNDAPVLMFDEPTSNLDPQSARLVRHVIKGLRDEGKAILLTTHNLVEADLLSDRIGIMDHGKIIATGRSPELKRSYSTGTIKIKLKNKMDKVPMILTGVAGVERISILSDPETAASVLNVVAADNPEMISYLLKVLQESGVAVEGITREEPTLEDVFIGLTGRELRD
jgi:ABC-2 type transport system ATP-binding protein